ncbi:MAG: deoxyribose-phosphate aldolase [Cyanobacteria bacterium P01_F01_bin.42]
MAHPLDASSGRVDRADFDLRDFIEHTLLAPFATAGDLEQLCLQAQRYRFPAVCVAPCHVGQAVELLYNEACEVYTVIGFPSGTALTATKRFEAQAAIDQGAQGLDVVINLGWLRDRDLDPLHRELAEICELAQKPVKAILEMAQLTDEEKRTAAEICLDAGVTYLKTSTGWMGGASVADVKLLRSIVGDRVGIKASGGIKDYHQAVELIRAGANRLGTSRGVYLMQMQEQLGE